MPEFIVKHSGRKHDVARFLHFHPGGANTLKSFEGCDITDQLLKTQHAPSAYELLKDYRLKELSKDDPNEEDLESLVNWEKPMFWQVGSLGSNYNKWVLSPVDRKLRLFQYDFMELMTVTPWYLVPSVWVPVSIYLMYCGYLRFLNIPPFDTCSGSFTVAVLFFTAVLGYFIWPLIEYSIHRWIFHITPPDDSPLLITLHFGIHGLHHKVPFDDQRLLFPPAATALIVWGIHGILRLFLPLFITLPLLAGGILGYVTYDLMHFYLHYGSPNEGSYLYHMKRYHNQHHFTNHQHGFGISCPLWDYVFDTAIKLKKLKYHMKW